jgi:hypothetical protein
MDNGIRLVSFLAALFRVKKRLKEIQGIARSAIGPTGKSVVRLSSPFAKNIPLSPSGKSTLELPPSRPTRGAYRDRHGRWVRDAMDADVHADERH